MTTAEYDLRYLRAGIDQLENYLMSKELYYPIGVNSPQGEAPYPQLTLGWLLMARLGAQTSVETPAEKAELARLEADLGAVHAHWRIAWGRKAAVEFKARLDLWREFLDEYRRHAEANFDRYNYEVKRRAILELLKTETEGLEQAYLDTLSSLDGLLQSIFIPGEFIWEAKQATVFPRKYFWYLYGTVPSKLS